MSKSLLFVGCFIHCEKKERVTTVKNGAIAVKNGKIVGISQNDNGDSLRKLLDDNAEIKLLTKNQFLCPGFIDLHIHASQFPNTGLGYDKSLLEWLESYTFPLEMKYKDKDFAYNVYQHVIKSTLSVGTTTACYFATIHTDSAVLLAEQASRYGQRALIGKVNMDQNCILDYTESVQESLSQTKKFIREVKNLNNPLVQPIITPRFAISCSMELMTELAKIAKEHDLYIQTHISENKDEVEFAKKLFPTSTSYADIYDKAALLTKKTILAHGVHLTESEKKLLSEKSVSIAHCPNSNTNIKSGLCDVQSLMNHNIKIGLGTDISAGSNPSILDAIRCGITTSIHLSFIKENYKPLSYHELFYLATMGGAIALGMEDKIGNFQVNKEFDALLVEMTSEHSLSSVLSNHSSEELFQKFLYTGDDRNIKKVYVNGQIVKE